MGLKTPVCRGEGGGGGWAGGSAPPCYKALSAAPCRASFCHPCRAAFWARNPSRKPCGAGAKPVVVTCRAVLTGACYKPSRLEPLPHIFKSTVQRQDHLVTWGKPRGNVNTAGALESDLRKMCHEEAITRTAGPREPPLACRTHQHGVMHSNIGLKASPDLRGIVVGPALACVHSQVAGGHAPAHLRMHVCLCQRLNADSQSTS